MRQLGFLMLFLGIGSIVLHFMEREFTWLMWIDNWGDNAAWGIRGGLVLLGAVMAFAGKSSDKSDR